MECDINEVLEQWNNTDSIIDDINLSRTSKETPIIHGKYLDCLVRCKYRLKKLEHDHKILLKNKWLYYNGKMTPAELKATNWDPDPLNGLKVLKGDMAYYYDSDPELQASDKRIDDCKILKDTLEQIISSLIWRHQTISNIIKWKQFELGV